MKRLITSHFIFTFLLLFIVGCMPENVAITGGASQVVAFEKDGSQVTSISINENSSIDNVKIVINGDSGNSSNYTFSITSGNQTLLPDANIVMTGSGKFRYLSITPSANQAGETLLTGNITDTSTGKIVTGTLLLKVLQGPQFSTGPFTAKYFLENDGNSPGVGTDGTNPLITPVLMGTATVNRIDINYSWDDFLGIDSYYFHAIWEGKLHVYDDTVINANFDSSWTDVTFYIDGQLHAKWNNVSNHSEVYPLHLTVGSHDIKVEFHNHWHTTMLNVTFSNYPQFVKSQAPVSLAPYIDANTKLIYLGAYEAGDLYFNNEIKVTIPASVEPVFLFLTSYNAVNWIIDNPHNTLISGAAFRSKYAGTSVNNIDSAIIFNITDLYNGYSEASYADADIEAITGRLPDYTFKYYDMGDVLIPAF